MSDDAQKKLDEHIAQVDLNEELPLRSSLIELEREVNQNYENWMKQRLEKEERIGSILNNIHKTFAKWLEFAIGSPSLSRVKELYDFCVYSTTESKELLREEERVLGGMNTVMRKIIEYQSEVEKRFMRNLREKHVLEKSNKQLLHENQYLAGLIRQYEKNTPIVEIKP